ncbi:hypothetical protein ONZ45_g14424 [Pleurotus djamor]|nr:hypothetical protein ONZ45_g14424 [Pleurotus djamor]
MWQQASAIVEYKANRSGFPLCSIRPVSTFSEQPHYALNLPTMGIGRLAVHTHLRLPQEVVDMIIDFLDARADWKHCARVCWSWVHASQLHLFRNISVSLTVLYGEEEPPVSRLKSVLDRAPHLAKHVRELEIVRDFGQCFNIRMQEQLLSLLIPLFPRIHSFSLKSVDCDQEFGIDASLLAAIRGILQSQHIKSITLYGWEFSDNAHFVSLMGDKLNSLTTFKIDSTGIDYRAPPSNHSVPKDGPPATLEILSISCSMKWIDDWFASLKHPVIVKKLILDGWGAGSLLITRFGKNLEELSLLMEDDYGPPIDFHHMKRLSKLVSTSSIDELVELHTIPEDNQLEDLELVHTWYWEISFAASAFNQLDELLASKHFSRLKTVTMVADRSSLSLEEFKLLRKTMRRVTKLPVEKFIFLLISHGFLKLSKFKTRRYRRKKTW